MPIPATSLYITRGLIEFNVVTSVLSSSHRANRAALHIVRSQHCGSHPSFTKDVKTQISREQWQGRPKAQSSVSTHHISTDKDSSDRVWDRRWQCRTYTTCTAATPECHAPTWLQHTDQRALSPACKRQDWVTQQQGIHHTGKAKLWSSSLKDAIDASCQYKTLLVCLRNLQIIKQLQTRKTFWKNTIICLRALKFFPRLFSNYRPLSMQDRKPQGAWIVLHPSLCRCISF